MILRVRLILALFKVTTWSGLGLAFTMAAHFMSSPFLKFLKFRHKDGGEGTWRVDFDRLKNGGGVVLREKGVVGRFSQGAARMRREGVGGRLGT
jgi:hypothetical protein